MNKPTTLKDWHTTIAPQYGILVKLLKNAWPDGNIADEAAYDLFLEIQSQTHNFIKAHSSSLHRELENRLEEMTMTDEQRKGNSPERHAAQQYWNLCLYEVRQITNQVFGKESV